MQNKYKVIIIGAGPIGLFLASELEKRNEKYLLLEASDHVGGQLINLYPEKEIVDIPGIECIKAKDYIALLSKGVNFENIHFEEEVIDIKDEGKVIIKTKKDEYECEKCVVTIGLGFSKYRPMGIEGEDDCTNIIYSIKEYDYLKNKKVAILGGGDSALDWAKTLSRFSDDIYLIHRRDEFRGNPETIKDCLNLHVLKPYVPHALKIENKLAKILTIKLVSEEEKYVDIPVDYIFVNYGNIPSSNKFTFEYEGNFIKVDSTFNASKNVFVIGDAASYENKKRRIAPGNEEARAVLSKLID